MLGRIESTITREGILRVVLREMPIPKLEPDQILIRIDASPVNPSDMSLMLGPVDMASLRIDHDRGEIMLTGQVPPERLSAVAPRLDQAIAIGNEGAGTIVEAGRNVLDLVGRKCSGLLRGGMFATHRVAEASDVMLLPDDLDAAEAAAMYINPLTVLAMTETMHREGHRAIVHTAAASNLGQMLVRLCVADGIDLVNIVRRDEQVDLLRSIGATIVLKSSSPDFAVDLYDALGKTGATMVFDALGGGTMADLILRTMEQVAASKGSEVTRYGSSVHKQAYIYSALSDGPSQLSRGYGQTWGIGPFFLPYVLHKLGSSTEERMRNRVLRDVRTIFASHYTASIALIDLLSLDSIEKITRRATNSKYLIVPHGQAQ